MDEHVFFEQGPVRVTSARFIVENRTFAMNGVTSVQSSVKPPDRGGPLAVIIVGVILLFVSSMGTKLVGLAFVALGIWLWIQQKNTYTVILHSASGEVQALADTNEAFIGGVIRALNDALVHRG